MPIIPTTSEAKMAKHSEPDILPTHSSRKPAVPKKSDTNYLGLILTIIVLAGIITVIVLSTGDRPFAAFFKGLMFKAGAGTLPKPKIVTIPNGVDIFGNPIITKKPDVDDDGPWNRPTTQPPKIPEVFNNEFNKSKEKPPVDKAVPSKYTLDYNGFHYKWFVQPYSFENAEKICKKVNGNLVYFMDNAEFLMVRNWTVQNVKDRYPLEEFGYYFTAGNRPYISEKETPRPDDNPNSEVSNLKWNISRTQTQGWNGIGAWCEDRNRDLGGKELKKDSYGWGNILEDIAKEESDKILGRWRLGSSVGPMLHLKVVMDLSKLNSDNESMGCLKLEYGHNDDTIKRNREQDELPHPSGMPFICKIKK